MQREIKFRVWHPFYGMMKPQDIFQMTSFKYDNEDGSKTLEKYYEPDVTFLQYTGLKDKNGVEIYEGDFIQNVADNGKRLSIFEIRWQQACCGFVKEREDGNTFTLEISKYFEVIGNVHENPELLTRAVGV
jgi:uncharacterized phage protein (TIGR01671 family)